jgi:hypothetical protein
MEGLMFCPNCGTSSDGTRFCRRCGTELERVAEALQAQDGPHEAATRSHVSAFGLFNSQTVSNAEGNFEGHVGLSIFGTVTADLRARPLPYGETRISLSSIFGTATVRVPEDVGVKITGLSVFSTAKVRGRRIGSGSVEGQAYETPGYSQMTRKVRIDATIIFGTLKIK